MQIKNIYGIETHTNTALIFLSILWYSSAFPYTLKKSTTHINSKLATSTLFWANLEGHAVLHYQKVTTGYKELYIFLMMKGL